MIIKQGTQELNLYFSTFKDFILSIPDSYNIVFAGVCALKAHGLVINRNANDLDVVIFSPTENQINFLKQMSFFEVKRNRIDTYDYPENQRSYKFKKDDLVIDILMAYNIPLPDDLLFAKVCGHMIQIQRIDLNIKAKNSYINELHNDSGLVNKYSRTKDVQDLIDLKNSNFNIES